MAPDTHSPLSLPAVIPESSIIAVCPHFDDFLFTLGSWVTGMGRERLLGTRHFHVVIIFSRSNYLARTGAANHDPGLDRLKLATGKRLLEDMDCIDELLGPFTHTYQLAGERECFVRGKSPAVSEMEFPHGMFDDFNEDDRAIFERMKSRIMQWATKEDSAIVMPIAFKEHIDHFIVREAGIAAARELGAKARAAFYFQEDKPYAGIADAAETGRIEQFIQANRLSPRPYPAHPERVIELAFRHYVSQVEPIYETGVRERARTLQAFYGTAGPCDCIYRLPSAGDSRALEPSSP
jgi:hypothetical protein